MPIHRLKLLSKQTIANDVIEFHFEKPQNFSFIPGQYGGFTLIDPPEKDPNGLTRRFSLFSTPDAPYIAIITRMQNSPYKRNLHALSLGAEIKFAGPTGIFTLEQDQNIPSVLLAGGIGIAPFHSMIQAQVKSGREIILFYGNPNLACTPALSDLTALSQQYPNFKCVITLDKPDANWQGETGYITHTMIKKYVADITIPFYYVCGSPAMVTNLQELLIEMGIEENHIKVEDFPGY